MTKICPICPHHCHLDVGQAGICGARKNEKDRIICINYGELTAIALDPIEKKPLARFMPGSKILSVGSFGCNFHCGFCQNHHIAAAENKPDTTFVPPETLVANAISLADKGNIGIAYTYNEPLIGYEYVRDCAKLAFSRGLRNVVVTNGYIENGPLTDLLPWVHAMNIDLKSFSPNFYQKIGGGLEPVKQSIAIAAKHTHVEVTTLVIPGENDSEEEMAALAEWLGAIDAEIPFHLSRFFPRYRYENRTPTPVGVLHRLAEIARKHLRYVYLGNC